MLLDGKNILTWALSCDNSVANLPLRSNQLILITEKDSKQSILLFFAAYFSSKYCETGWNDLLISENITFGATSLSIQLMGSAG